jgi:hypothetical protein
MHGCMRSVIFGSSQAAYARMRVCCEGAGMAERRPLAAVAGERDEPQDQHWKTGSHGGVLAHEREKVGSPGSVSARVDRWWELCGRCIAERLQKAM